MKYKFSARALNAGENVLTKFEQSEIESNLNSVVAEIVDAVLDRQRTIIRADPQNWPNYEIPLAIPPRAG